MNELTMGPIPARWKNDRRDGPLWFCGVRDCYECFGSGEPSETNYRHDLGDGLIIIASLSGYYRGRGGVLVAKNYRDKPGVFVHALEDGRVLVTRERRAPDGSLHHERRIEHGLQAVCLCNRCGRLSKISVTSGAAR